MTRGKRKAALPAAPPVVSQNASHSDPAGAPVPAEPAGPTVMAIVRRADLNGAPFELTPDGLELIVFGPRREGDVYPRAATAGSPSTSDKRRIAATIRVAATVTGIRSSMASASALRTALSAALPGRKRSRCCRPRTCCAPQLATPRAKLDLEPARDGLQRVSLPQVTATRAPGPFGRALALVLADGIALDSFRTPPGRLEALLRGTASLQETPCDAT